MSRGAFPWLLAGGAAAGGSKERIDPAPLMTAWEYLPDPGEPTGTLVARNAGSRAHLVPVRAHTRRWPR
jgi:hypothetical protein